MTIIIQTNEQQQQVVTPLPKLYMTLATLVTIAEAFSHNSFATLVAFQVRFYKITKHSADESFYAGILLAMFPLTQTFSSSLWGVVSDRIGRKAVICIGLFVHVLCLIGLAFTRNFYLDMVLRATQGTFDSLLATTRSYIHDVTDESNDANAYAMISLVWTISSRMAAVISGLLSSPGTKYKAFARNGFLLRFPFCIVGFVSAGLNLVVLLLCIIFMNSDNHAHHHDKESAVKSTTSLDTKTGDEEKKKPNWFTSFLASLVPLLTNGLFVKALFFTFLCNVLFEYVVASTNFCRTFSVMVRLWLAESRNVHGMGWSSSIIGILLATSFIGSFLVLRINWFREKFGLLYTTRFFIIQATILTLVTPFCYEFSTLFRRDLQWIVYVAFSILWILRASCVNVSNVSQSILMNNCVDQSLNGAAHGVAGTASSIAWVIAPLLSGSLMTGTVRVRNWLKKHHIWIPLVEKTPFAVLGVISLITLLFTFAFPKSAEHSLKKPVEEQV